MSLKVRKILCVLLSAVICMGLAVSAFAAGEKVSYSSGSGKYSAVKISHADKPLGTADGVVDYVGNGVVSGHDKGQGDRSQNYIWASVPYGDYVYMTLNYNSMVATLEFMDSVLGNDYDVDKMKATLDTMFNGAFHTGVPDGANTGGVLLKMNIVTGEVKVLMARCIDGRAVQLRNGCEYEGKIYFCGSVNGLPKIVQVDPATDECTIVYESINAKDFYQAYLMGLSPTIRGLCEYDGKLIISVNAIDGAHILYSDHPWDGQDAFVEIADDDALYNYAAYHFCDSIYGGAIWDMLPYNNKLYVAICTGTPDNMPDENTMQSFAVVRGEEQADGSWKWTPVIGDKADGARYTFGIDPERTRSGGCTLYVYNDYLYIGEYNDEEIAMERILFQADFDFMNANLAQSVNLYRMNEKEDIELVVGDKTKMFPKGGISGLGSGFGRNENQYIWRLTEYKGKLYAGTFDTSSLLEPLGQFVNGDLMNMSAAEWESLLGYLKKLVALSSGEGETADMAALFEKYSISDLAKMFEKGKIEEMFAKMGVKDVMKSAQGLLECANYLSTAKRGFDLYVSEDGVHFETVTLNGFGDPYNHGLRTFSETPYGLMVGTANPFYAGQVWLFNEDESIPSGSDPIEAPTKNIFTIFTKLLNYVLKFIDILRTIFSF